MINRIIFALLIVIGIYSCSEKDTYDWSRVEPGSQVITGPDTIKGNDITLYEFLAIPRGGSKFNWTVLSGPVVLTYNESNKYGITAKANSSVDTEAYIRLDETTHGGKTGISDTVKVFIQCFIPYNVDKLIGSGSYMCSYKDFVPYSVNVSNLAGDTLLIDNFFGMGWPLKLIPSKDVNETLSIINTLDFEYNGEPVEIKGKGEYSICKNTIDIHFAVLKLNGDTLIENEKTKGAGVAHYFKN